MNSQGITISGALMAGAGAFTLTQWLAIGGFAIALLGFISNFAFRLRKDRRETEEHLFKMKELKNVNR